MTKITNASSLKFLSGEDLSKEIKRLLAQPNVRCAVAYWGSGAYKLLVGNKPSIICNLRSGGTNPFALKKLGLPKDRILQCDNLHAKVYLGAKEAIVTSANASFNGLGNDSKAPILEEAGILLSNIDMVDAWFEKIRKLSRVIEDQDWKRAELNWIRRPNPSAMTIGEYDLDDIRVPLINWWEHEKKQDDTQTRKHANRKSGSIVSEKVLKKYRERISEGVDIEGRTEIERKREQELLTDRWILWWKRSGRKRATSTKLQWSLLDSEIVHKVSYDSEGDRKLSVVVQVNNQNSVKEPFDISDPDFLLAFDEGLRTFSSLSENGNEGAWITPAYELENQKFWLMVQKVYRERKNLSR